MNIQKLLTKYAILLLIYIGIFHFVQPYGLKLYYTLSSSPDLMANSVNTIQSALTAITFLINLIFVIFILIDSKRKILVDWLIATITFFSAESGVLLFLIWQIYKETKKKY